MKAAILITSALAFHAGAALAEGGPKQDEIEAFRAAIAAVGCTLTPANASRVLDISHLTEEDVAAVIQQLEGRGKIIRAADGTLTLVPDACRT